MESKNTIFTQTLPVDNCNLFLIVALDKKWGIDFFKDKCFLYLFSKPFTVFILDIQSQIFAEYCNIYKPIIAAFINMNLKSVVGVSLDGRIIIVRIHEDPEMTEHKIKLHLHHTHGFVNIFHDKISNVLYLQTVDHISCYYSKDVNIIFYRRLGPNLKISHTIKLKRCLEMSEIGLCIRNVILMDL